jgi:uncharacterized membrane protein YdbT with pleckstrin-like domain
MRLREDRLPITLRQTRRGYLFSYLLAFVLIGLGAAGLYSGTLPVLHPVFYWFIGGGGFAWLLGLEVNRLMNSLRMEKDRVTLQKGILSIEHIVVYYDKLTDVRIYQSLWARIMAYGSIYLNTPGHGEGGEYELFLDKIPSPHRVRAFIEELRQKKHGHGQHAAHVTS